MNEIFHLINEMSPYLLLGFLIAGLMHAFVPGKYYTRYLAKPTFRSVLYAALFGVPLPLCSCGVIPTAMSLRKEGASKGAVASFLIATPQTGVDSIIATYSLMGLPFAIIRPIVAFITALFGGSLVNKVTKKEGQLVNDRASGQVEALDHCHEEAEKTESCCCHHHDEEKEEHCCCHHEHSSDSLKSEVCQSEKEAPCHCHEHSSDSLKSEACQSDKEAHCHCHHAEAKEGMTFWQKMGVALRYAFVDMVEDIGKWLVVGLVIAALITVLVPDSFFAVFKDNTWLSMLLVLAISIPMYICATGSIPIAVALMLKGLTPGSALVLLMAGPAANMASILVIRHRLGTRTLVAYLASIISGAVIFGAVIDYLLPRHWFTEALVQMEHCTEAGTPFTWACTALLALLLLYALIQRLRHPHHHHDHE